MKPKHIFILSFLTMSTLEVFPQDTISRASQQAVKQSISIGLNSGPIFFFGDIGQDDYNPAFTNKLAYKFSINRPISNALGISLNLIAGKVFGEKQFTTENINFRSSIFSQSLMLNYNFHPLLNHLGKKPLLSPFVSVGIETVLFKPKTDMTTSDGQTYHYWTDGSIKNLPENLQNIDEAKNIERDYEYETELRDLNLDGNGNYSLFTFAVPISAGININLSQNFNLRVEAEYHKTFSDNIDNISPSGDGNRKGAKGSDNYLLTSFGVFWNIQSTAKTKKTWQNSNKDETLYEAAKSEGIQRENELGELEKTENEVEPTPNNKNSNSEQKTDEQIDSNSIIDKKIATSDGEKIRNSEKRENIEKTISETHYNSEQKRIHWGDLNNDGIVKADEVYIFIERFLEGDKSLSIKELDSLLEFYFEQD